MSIAVVVWQVFIFLTLIISGKKRGWVATFWVIWTLVQVYALPLSIIQFITIAVGFLVAKPRINRPISPAADITAAPAIPAKAQSTRPEGLSNDVKRLLTLAAGIAAMFGVAYYWERELVGPSNVPPLLICGIAIVMIVRWVKYW